MDNVRFINIKESILSDNQDLADQVRAQLGERKVYILNLIASPRAGKQA